MTTTMEVPTEAMQLQGLSNAQCITLWFRTLDKYRAEVEQFDAAIIGQVEDRIVTPREALARFKAHMLNAAQVVEHPGFKRAASTEYNVLSRLACDLFRVRLDELGNSYRHKRVVAARMFIVHLLRKQTTYSYPEIARMMHKPNHSTVITAHQRLQRAIEEGEKFEVWNSDTNRFEFWPAREILETLERAKL